VSRYIFENEKGAVLTPHPCLSRLFTPYASSFLFL